MMLPAQTTSDDRDLIKRALYADAVHAGRDSDDDMRRLRLLVAITRHRAQGLLATDAFTTILDAAKTPDGRRALMGFFFSDTRSQHA